MAAGTPFSARNARAKVGDVYLLACKWSAACRSAESDTTTVEGTDPRDDPPVVFADRTSEVRDLEVTLEGFWDPNVSYFANDSLPCFLPGSTVKDVKLYLDASGSLTEGGAIDSDTALVMPSAFVAQATVDAEVRGVVKVSLVLKNKGPFSMPQQI